MIAGIAQPSVTVGTVNGTTPGQIISVPVTVSGCDATTGGTGITGLEMHISYTNAVQYFGYTNLYSGFSVGDCNFNGVSNQFVGLWSSPTLLAYSIPDGTVLFEVQFMAKQGGTSPLNFMSIGNQTILMDANFDIIATATWTNGSVTLPAPAAVTTWNSATAQSWTTVANWSNGLPGAGSTAVVGSGIMTMDNSNMICQNLTVNAGAALTINSGVTVTVPGNFKLDSEANNTRTGSLINNGTLNVSGQRIVNRWIAGGKNHFISTPLRLGTTVNSLYVPTNSGWAYRWNEPTAAWVNLISFTEPIQVGYGYVVNYNLNQTLSFSITDNPGFNTGNSYNPNTSYTSANGWNLVGNPYLASLNWNGSGWTKSKIDATVYYYNGTTYASWNGTVGVNGGTQYIPAMQGFFVHANGSGPNFVIPKASLVHNAQTYYKETIANVLRLRIVGNSYADEAVIMFDENSTVGIDAEYDAYKLMSMNEDVPQIYSSGSENDLSINVMPEIVYNMNVPVGVKIGQAGTYKLEAEEVSSFGSDVAIFLEDLSNGSIIDLRSTPEYTFEAMTGDSDRFRVRFEKSTGLGLNSGTNSSVFANGKNIIISNLSGVAEVYSVSGQKITSVKLSDNSLNSIDLGSATNGVYLVKIISGDDTIITKVLVK